MGLVDDAFERDFVVGCIVLQAPEDSGGICVGFTGERVWSLSRCMTLAKFLFGQKWLCRASLALAARSLRHCHFQEQVVGRDCGRQQALGEGVVWAERHRDELFELVELFTVCTVYSRA